MDRLRDEARCPVCLDFLQEPVSVDCGHSFCRACISELCDKADSARGGVYACPQCRAPFRPSSLRPNRQLAGLVDSVRRLGLAAIPAGARRCARHGEPLSRFCEEDRTALCWVCAAAEHRGHRSAPLPEAAARYQVRVMQCWGAGASAGAAANCYQVRLTQASRTRSPPEDSHNASLALVRPSLWISRGFSALGGGRSAAGWPLLT